MIQSTDKKADLIKENVRAYSSFSSGPEQWTGKYNLSTVIFDHLCSQFITFTLSTLYNKGFSQKLA